LDLLDPWNLVLGMQKISKEVIHGSAPIWAEPFFFAKIKSVGSEVTRKFAKI